MTCPGLGVTQPLPALALAVCLLSLCGNSAPGRILGQARDLLRRLRGKPGREPACSSCSAVIGVLNAAVGAYYYLRIVVTMYLEALHARRCRQPAACQLRRPSLHVRWAVSVLGLFPGPINRASRAAAVAAVVRGRHPRRRHRTAGPPSASGHSPGAQLIAARSGLCWR